MVGKYVEESALLVGQEGGLNGQRWSISKHMVIGRDDACDITIPDRQVSRHHARISVTSQGVTIEDLGSKNGTHRNGQVLTEPSLLEDGDIIQIAFAQQFLFLSSDATVPLGQPYHAVSNPKILSPSLRLEKKSRRIWIDEIEIDPPLSVPQFQLLELLYDQEGKVVSRSELITYIWGDEQAIVVSEQALDALVRRLRDRLSRINPDHSYISTIRGHGLRLVNPT
jgi:DNA-binding winged helix-turn-helix (wHTH) protein